MSQTDKQLEFCCTIDDMIDIHDETITSYTNYIKSLESQGFELMLYDGTVVQTYELKDGKYTVTITLLSDGES